MNPFPLVLADLRSIRLSGAFIVLLIGLAVALGVAVGAQERALRQASARAAADFPLLIGAPGSQTQLVLTAVYLQPEALPLMSGQTLNSLLKDPRVADAAPIAYGDVVIGYPVVGTTTRFVTRWGRLAPVEGRVFAKEGEAVVGADVKLVMGQIVSPAHAVAGASHGPASRARKRRAIATTQSSRLLGGFRAFIPHGTERFSFPSNPFGRPTGLVTVMNPGKSASVHLSPIRSPVCRPSSSSRAGWPTPINCGRNTVRMARWRCSRRRF